MFLAPDDVLWEKSGERNGKLYGSMREMICGWRPARSYNPSALQGIYHGEHFTLHSKTGETLFWLSWQLCENRTIFQLLEIVS